MEPYLGQISMMAFNFPPKDWAFCSGDLQQISQNPALFALINTYYGGDGRTTYALPDLRGRAPVHRGWLSQYEYTLGQNEGTETVTLTESTLPRHTHTVYASSEDADKGGPNDQRILAATPDIYRPLTNPVPMNSNAVGMTGGTSSGDTKSFPNIQPSLAINFCIAISGYFPPRN
ncbi:tail fiber protein [Hahella aquimaris]|uniref:phage tail protein n=1 Tax=Hahella sp. HNIBRBA332 TaxID=3015983 RepID=UPI00273BDDA4|nr:tail fiber protein [Hahella sp. HNIBRBA332]WLQ13951.1 tail fiber protein [Hahella sp. HNIBRBA332]